MSRPKLYIESSIVSYLWSKMRSSKKSVQSVRFYAERFGFDVRALFRDVMERQEKSDRKLVTLEPKSISTYGPKERS